MARYRRYKDQAKQYNARQQAKYATQGLCPVCGKNPRGVRFKTCDSCRENVRRNGQAYRQRLRLAAYDAYGGRFCACCKETHLEFLTIDHVNGDGAKDRRENGAGDKLHRRLRDLGYPPGFRVLCFNCNYATYKYGTCPHKNEK